MSFLPKTLRGQLILMIICMNIITVASASFIIQTYWHQIKDNERHASQELLQTEILALQNEHRKLVTELASRVATKKPLKNAVKIRDIATIEEYINEEFFQYYVTAEILDVNKILVFDKELTFITQSTEGEDYGLSPLCKDIVDIARQRTGIERVKYISSLCYKGKHSFFSTIVPIGSLNPLGYIQIITEPAKTLIKLEAEFNIPIQITTPDSDLLYESNKWNPHDKNLLQLDVMLKGLNNKNTLKISTLKDITKLNKSIDHTRNLIFLFVGCISIFTIIVFFKLLDSSMIKPMRSLMEHLSSITTDKKILQETLPEKGSHEIRSLTSSFNLLTSHLNQLYKSLENLAFTDQLTTLPNRSRLKEVLQFHHDQYEAHGLPYSLLMMDLNGFKSVNDTLGHHAGDQLLQQVSSRLSKVLRKTDYISSLTENDLSQFQSDVIARLGGDEFAAVLPSASEMQDISNVGKKILGVMEAPFVIDNCNFSVGISIGIAQCPLHGLDPNTLMRHADVAMYESKKTHQGYTFYDESIDEHSIKMLTLDEELKKAIINDSLELLYQPKIDLQSQKLIGVEALIRWPHADHGVIYPDQFIPRAEQSGLINELTHWVIKTAIKQKAHWDKIALPISVSINLSAKNLLDPQLIPSIKKQLDAYSVQPDSLYLEITETAIMSDAVRSIVVLQELYDLGVRISIDDFGTGYSSLSYLKKLPADEIKIDRSFVMDMENDANDAIIVQSTIDLAHNMGLRVVAEGVETQSILDQLTANECDYAQGYYIARPLATEIFHEWLTTSHWSIK